MKQTHITGNTYYIDIHGTSTGIYYLTEKDIVLIDSGGRFSLEFLSWLKDESLNVKAVIHTHIHEDHVANTDKIYDTYKANLFARQKDIDDSYGYLRRTDKLMPNKGTIIIDGAKFKTILTPGHTMGHQLVITPDNVCFLGDALMTKKSLDASKLPYQLDGIEFLRCHKTIAETSYPYYVASHKGLVRPEEISYLIDINQEKLNRIYEGILIHTVAGESVKDAAMAYLKDMGISERTLSNHYWIPEMIKDRIYELALMGKIKVKKGVIL